MKHFKIPKPQKSTIKAIRWMCQTFIKEWKISLVVLVFITLNGVLNPLSPLLLKEILDHGLTGESNYSLKTLLITFALLPLFIGIFNLGLKYFSTLLSERVGNNLQAELYEKVMRKSLTFFIRNKSGQIMQRILQEPGEVNLTMSNVVTQFISSSFVLISTLTTMYYLNPVLTVTAIIFLPLILVPGPIISRKSARLNTKSWDSRAESLSKVQETLSASGAFLIKTLGTYELELENFRNNIRNISKYNLLNVLLMEGTAILTNFFGVFAPVAVFWVASTQIAKGHITIGTIVAFTTYLVQLSDTIKALSGIWIRFPTLITMINRLIEYRDDSDELKFPAEQINTSHFKGAISFKNVVYYYDENRKILDHISFHINAGETVALVGESGSGKTTIAQLISRLCDPNSGEVYLDGLDIKSYDAKSLSKLISFVPQEPFLFHASIRDNIAYGCPDVSEEAIEEAARKAFIHDVIMKMPEKYDTIVGERGFRLSTGEKQRVALARVFLRDSKIVILDEVTSSLDSLSESIIKKALFNLLQNRTGLIIAHRLSTIVDCDRILVLEKGKIVEEGDFISLISNDGKFKELYTKQMEKQEEKRSAAVNM
jgi:ATP-binding cassette, subfamily B, bacterial